MKIIEARDLEAIALGGAVYGTGGGGDPYLGKLMAQNVIRSKGAVRLISVDTLADDALVLPVAGIGAPGVLLEKMATVEQLLVAIDSLETFLGKRATAIMPIEAGGLNSTIPFCAASALGLPLIDGDAIGRAFPEIQMTTCTLNGIAATPASLADEKGNSVILRAISNVFTERFLRSLTGDMGGSAFSALYPMTGAQAKKAVIRGSISRLMETGKAILEARISNTDPVAATIHASGGIKLYSGKVIDVKRIIEGGFSKGQARITGLNESDGSDLILSFQNEFLVARHGESVLTTTPDLIVVLDLETGEPVTGELMRYGLRVAVVGIPCVSQWRSEGALKLVGPRYFGYDFEYVSVEDLAIVRGAKKHE
jgi:uncharacterized protein